MIFENLWHRLLKTMYFLPQLKSTSTSNAYPHLLLTCAQIFQQISSFFNVLQHTTFAACYKSHSIRLVLFFQVRLTQWTSKWFSWLWPLWVWHLQTVWNSQLLKLFEFSPRLDLSNRFSLLNSRFLKICLNFTLSSVHQERQSYIVAPHRMVGTVLTSWLWRSHLSNCLRRASLDFPCSDPSVC